VPTKRKPVRERMVGTGCQPYPLTLAVTVEREGGTKPVCVAEFLVRRYV
jgi:hypothetical protein